MRNGFLLAVGALAATVGLVQGQMPYGYAPAYPSYPPSYGYYAPPQPAYGYYPAYGYPQPYPPAYYVAPAAAPPSPYPPAPNGVVPGRVVSAPSAATPHAPGDQLHLLPVETPPSKPMTVIDVPTEPPASGPSPAPPTHGPLPQAAPLADPGMDKPASGPLAATGHGHEYGWLDLGGVTNWCAACPTKEAPRVWGSAEYLSWWIKDAPLPIPLVTTGIPAPGVSAGALGQPGTGVVSPSALSFDRLNGGRATVGGWVDGDRRCGVEASGFLMETRVAGATVASTAAGTPDLFLPFFNPLPGLGESALQLSAPGVSRASVVLSAVNRLWGAEGNGLYRIYTSPERQRGDGPVAGAPGLCNSWLNADLLAGFRYLDLHEDLTETTLSSALVGPSATTIGYDRFATRNQVFGGQLGGRVEMHCGRLFLDVTAKVAAGDNHESVTINGGGLFTQATNAGHRSRDAFTVLPEGQAQVGVDVCRYARIFAGYSFLYASDVLRPGDQIDRTVNPTQFGGAPLVGPARPLPQFNSTDFWAHGVSAGVLFRY